MALLDREYRLSKPEDVRALWNMNSHKIKLMLALVYKINESYSKIGYSIKRERAMRDDEWKARIATEIGHAKASRIRLTGKLKDLCRLTGMTMSRQMGGRITYIVSRIPARGQRRPPGALKDLNQKGLFIFADMYSEDQLLGLIVNEAMFGDN